MPLAQLQCFCGETIGLSAPQNKFSRPSPPPQEFTAKCPCGRNWRIILSQRNPAYAQIRKNGDQAHGSTT
jgi:hypothetical protein